MNYCNIDKIKSKPISRILLFIFRWILIIYLNYKLLYNFSCSPLEIERVVLNRICYRTERIFNIRSIAPHRVYLISLQPNCTCFLLHLSYPSADGWRMLSAMLLYGVRTFLPVFLSKENQTHTKTGSVPNSLHGDKMTYFWQKYI